MTRTILEAYDSEPTGGVDSAYRRYLCPVCDHPNRDDAHRSLSVHNTGTYLCFRCGFTGQIEDEPKRPRKMSPLKPKRPNALKDKIKPSHGVH